MLSKSSNANPNYLATVCQLGDPIIHPGADKLQIFIVQGCRVITDLSYKKGDTCVFFPIECKLNSQLASGLNMYEEKELNLDKTKKGYINKHSRVRAVRLRGEPTMGLILKVSDVSNVLGVCCGTCFVAARGTEFDIWNETLICEKYVPPARIHSQRTESGKKGLRNAQDDRLVDGQFRLHVDTTQLRSNIDKLRPQDLISITKKLHGTSWVVGNVLTKIKLNWKQRLAKFFGVPIQELEYDTLYSSRSVIKNKFANGDNGGYYGTDLWGDIKAYLDGKIPKGFTLYGEAVGYTRNGALIQKGYDYGYHITPSMSVTYEEGIHFGIYVYRITFTNQDGHKVELSWPQIVAYCAYYGIKTVPELYYGYKNDLSIAYGDELLKELSDKYLEKDCSLCTIPNTPDEGIVLRIDDLHECRSFKLKSFRFLERESKSLDDGTIDLETEQSTQNGEEGIIEVSSES